MCNLYLKNMIVFMGLWACVSFSSFANNLDNSALNYYCSTKQVEFQKNIRVGKGTRVHLNEGPFFQIEQTGEFDPSLDFIKRQMVQSGVSNECSEFLLTQGLFNPKSTDSVLARVYFDFNKSSLTSQSQYVLNNIVRLIKENGQSLILEGHTDSVGSQDYNFSLGLKRSESVEQYLMNAGVKKTALTTISKGQQQPIASNITAEGRKENRRVDIK